MKYYVGIDPGKNGALAIINDCNKRVDIYDLEDRYVYFIRALSEDWDNEYYGCVEDVCGRPGQAMQSTTTFMKLAGKAELLAECICDDVLLVKPQVWKKHFGLVAPKGTSKTEKKRMSLELAKSLFPQVSALLTPSRHDRAEALLIALYRKQYDEQNNQR